MIVVATKNPDSIIEDYSKLWSIETMFGNLKTSTSTSILVSLKSFFQPRYSLSWCFGSNKVCLFEEEYSTTCDASKKLIIYPFSDIVAFFEELKETETNTQISFAFSGGENNKLNDTLNHENLCSLGLWFPGIKSLETVNNVWVGNQAYIFHSKSFNCLKQSGVEVGSLWSYYSDNVVPFFLEYESQFKKEKTWEQSEEEFLCGEQKTQSREVCFLDAIKQLLPAKLSEEQQVNRKKDKLTILPESGDNEHVKLKVCDRKGKVASLLKQFENKENHSSTIAECSWTRSDLTKNNHQRAIDEICHQFEGKYITDRKQKIAGSSWPNSNSLTGFPSRSQNELDSRFKGVEYIAKNTTDIMGGMLNLMIEKNITCFRKSI
ncbi:MAG: hypothetical protein QS721_14215 [Candidatus Endonucleobacter sp. (ex Gigantidas childressi)]|nr:hypothetical protein [Candidatus Endonucleobacter sp. (ex Gigantidas childressi)]